MDRLLLVCLGGAVGSAARYLFVSWTQRALGESFPWGVLGVNVVGSFLIALLSVLALSKLDLSPAVRLGLSAGVLGGLTTYSSFNQDTLVMLDRRLYGTAAVYVAVTLVSCLGAGALAVAIGRRV